MIEYIFVKSTDKKYISEIYKIIFQCGLNMAKKGLYHWLKPYPKSSIRKDCDSKIVVLVKNMESGEYTSTFQMYINDGGLYVRKIATSPKNESKGIGQSNMQYMENYAIQQGCSKICLDVYKKSTRAVSFYIKYGFKITGETKSHFFSEYIMEKDL